ncbi:hypothetical protein EAF04_004914 [Stromatinia cepivora]|nr:hypothetical protein EAF04_004914 [Stromatinia cepivora]
MDQPGPKVSKCSSTTSSHSAAPNANAKDNKEATKEALGTQLLAHSIVPANEDDPDQRVANLNRTNSPENGIIVLAKDTIPLSQVVNYIRNCNVSDAQKHLLIQESKKAAAEDEMKYYKAADMTKGDVDELNLELAEHAKRGYDSHRKLRLMRKRLEQGTSERKIAIRDFFNSRPDYVNNTTFGPPFVKCFIDALTERDACRALNAVVIARLTEFENSRNERGKNRGKRPVPEIVTSDIVKAQKRYSITIMPCGLIGLCTNGVVNTRAVIFKDEPSSQSTLSVIIDEPYVGMKHSPKVVEPVMEPYSTSIDPQSRDKLPATPKSMSQKRQLTMKESLGTKKAKTGDELTIKETQLELLKQLSKELLRSRKRRDKKKDKKDKKDKKKGRKC